MKLKEKEGTQKEKSAEDSGVTMDTIIKNAEMSDGWVVQNLRKFHNSLIPGSVIEDINGRLDLLPTLIEYASGIPVKIETDGDSIIAWEILK